MARDQPRWLRSELHADSVYELLAPTSSNLFHHLAPTNRRELLDSRIHQSMRLDVLGTRRVGAS